MNESAVANPVGLTVSPHVQAQQAELRELAKQFPEPTLAEVMEDWKWLYEEWNGGKLFHMAEQLFAACEGKLVGTATDDVLAFRIRLSKQFQKHPERFAITYLGEYIPPYLG